MQQLAGAAPTGEPVAFAAACTAASFVQLSCEQSRPQIGPILTLPSLSSCGVASKAFHCGVVRLLAGTHTSFQTWKFQTDSPCRLIAVSFQL